MATKAQLQRLIKKILTDAAFRQKFLKNPQTAAASVKVVLTAEQANVIKNFGGQIKRALDALEKMIVKVRGSLMVIGGGLVPPKKLPPKPKAKSKRRTGR